MIWSWWTHKNAESRADTMRRTHARFLAAALASAHMFPRIPVRRADQGGFNSLVSRPRGRRAADAWWDRAFTALPNDTDA